MGPISRRHTVVTYANRRAAGEELARHLTPYAGRPDAGATGDVALGMPPWVMHQRWTNLLFAHWPVPPRILQPLLPPSLTLDTFDGEGYAFGTAQEAAALAGVLLGPGVVLLVKGSRGVGLEIVAETLAEAEGG